MRRVVKTLGRGMFAALLLSIVAIVGSAALIGSLGPFDDTVIRLNDTTLTLSQLGFADWVGIAVGIGFSLIAAFIVLVVVLPLAVLLPLILVALVLGAVGLAFAAAMALACSPLIRFAGAVWLVWRLLRRSAQPRAVPPLSNANRSAGAGTGGATMTR